MNYNFDKKMDEILNKKFKSKIHSGYDPEDVDKFFDEIINYIRAVNDYRLSIDNTIDNYERKIEHLSNQIKEKDKMINTLQTKVDELNKEGYSYGHIMKRMDRLEDKIQKNDSDNRK